MWFRILPIRACLLRLEKFLFFTSKIFVLRIVKLACHYSCLNCKGPYFTDCLPNQCSGNHIYSNELCVCPFWAEDFGKNITCSSKINLNHIINQKTWDKTKLDCHKSCNASQCYGPDQHSCYSCKEDRYLSNNTCFCKDLTFEDPSDPGGECKSRLFFDNSFNLLLF